MGYEPNAYFHPNPSHGLTADSLTTQFADLVLTPSGATGDSGYISAEDETIDDVDDMFHPVHVLPPDANQHALFQPALAPMPFQPAPAPFQHAPVYFDDFRFHKGSLSQCSMPGCTQRPYWTFAVGGARWCSCHRSIDMFHI